MEKTLDIYNQAAESLVFRRFEHADTLCDQAFEYSDAVQDDNKRKKVRLNLWLLKVNIVKTRLEQGDQTHYDAQAFDALMQAILLDMGSPLPSKLTIHVHANYYRVDST
jgi:hypothetical protein